jgi:signal transduction histidine kinase
LAGLNHLEQVMMNLVANALAYSNGSVVIEIFDAGFSVKDEGPGFPEDVLERVGEPFNRDSKTGHGLGLAWVATIARFYGWALDVQSTPSGSTVTIKS